MIDQKQHTLSTAADLMEDFLCYDRKAELDFSLLAVEHAVIERAIKNGVVTKKEILTVFRKALDNA